MTTWQPPIPSGALYSPAAIELGAGIALLAWCYDQIERDGSLQVRLEQAAADIGKPYGTVRDWWKLMKDGPFFSEVAPQGRKGWRAKFKPKWVDWRIVEKNYPQRRSFSDENENTADTPAVKDDCENTAEISEVSSLFDRWNTSDQGSAYKVLIPTDQAVFADAATAAPPPPVRKPKKATHTPEQQAYLDRKKAIEVAYVKALGYKPAAFGAEAKAAKWLAEQDYTAEQVIGCLETLQQDKFYDGKHIRLQVVANQIGAWVKARSRPIVNPGANIPVIRAPENPEPRRIRTQEEIDDLYFKATGKYPKLRLPNA
mgnify:CR=1 FL=1